MIAGETYRCGLDWCSDQSFEWWTIPLFVVVVGVGFVVLRKEVRRIRRELRDLDE